MNKVMAIAGVVVKELMRRKDFYVLFVMTALIALLMLSINFFNQDNATRGIQEICLLLIWISGLVIGIGTAARQIPAERENRTIFPLLAKPVTRGQFVLGKFLGCWLACGASLLVFHASFWVLSASRDHQWNVMNYFLGMWMQWMFLSVVIAMTLWGSLVFAAPSSNGTIILVMVSGELLLGRHLDQIGGNIGGWVGWLFYATYFAVPHLEWFDVREMVFQHHALQLQYCAAASVYALAYAGMFLLATWFSFRRKALQT